jgi:signal transduction histidine kinase
MTQPMLEQMDLEEIQKLYSEFDRQRSLQLTGRVGLGFAGIAGGALVIMGLLTVLHAIPNGSFALTMAVALGVAILLFLVGVWRNSLQHEVQAAISIIAGTLLIMGTFQIGWENLNGLDPIVIGALTATIVVIAMGGVLGNYTVMLVVTGVSVVDTLALCFVVPGHATTPLSHAIIACLVIIVVQATAGFFYLLASTTYISMLERLGLIRDAYINARRLDELKDQFITNANHELRNPIMALYTYVDTVRRAGNVLNEAQRVAMLDQAIEMGDRVLALLESILDVRRIDQGIGDFTSVAVDVAEAIRVAASMVDLRQLQQTERAIEVQLPPHLQIWGDAVLLQEILTNLISNAAKYSAPETRIELTGRLLNVPDGRSTRPAPVVELRIRDYGLGIPAQYAPVLFQRFVRLPRDLASTVSGNGLGLYLCRVLAQAMQGSIRLESTGVAGEGTTFILRLPPPPESQTPKASGDPAAAREHRHEP